MVFITRIGDNMKKLLFTFVLLISFIFIFSLPVFADDDFSDDFNLDGMYFFDDEFDFSFLQNNNMLLGTASFSGKFVNSFTIDTLPNVDDILGDYAIVDSFIDLNFYCTYTGPNSLYNFKIEMCLIDSSDPSGYYYQEVYTLSDGWIYPDARFIFIDNISSSENNFSTNWYSFFSSLTTSFPRISINGWFTFNNLNYINSSPLDWDYPLNNDINYPIVNYPYYVINVSANLAYSVESSDYFAPSGNPLLYTFIDSITIEEIGNDLSRVYFTFSFNSIEVEPIRVLVFDGGRWINDNYRYLLFSNCYISDDFYDFLISNGSFTFIPNQSNSTITELLFTYIDIPTRVLHSVLDFEILGTSFIVIIGGLISCIFIVYLIKRLL